MRWIISDRNNLPNDPLCKWVPSLSTMFSVIWGGACNGLSADIRLAPGFTCSYISYPLATLSGQTVGKLRLMRAQQSVDEFGGPGGDSWSLPDLSMQCKVPPQWHFPQIKLPGAASKLPSHVSHLCDLAGCPTSTAPLKRHMHPLLGVLALVLKSFWRGGAMPLK